MRIHRKNLKEYALKRKDFVLFYNSTDDTYYIAGTNMPVIDDLTILQKLARWFIK